MENGLRPYQEALVGAIAGAWRYGQRRVLAVLPTGGGKSVVAAEVVRRVFGFGGRVLVLAHRRELVAQLAQKVEGALGESVDRYLPGVALRGCRVAVGTVQTYARRPGEGWDLIVVDEAHHAPADTYARVLAENPQARVLGFTATPFRLDGLGLGELFEALVQGPTVAELQALGYLVPARYLVAERSWDLQGVRVVSGDYDPKALEERAVLLEADVVEAYLRHARGRRALVYAVSRRHAQDLARRFREAGAAVLYLDGDTPEAERDRGVSAFREGRVEVLVNVQLFTEGLDVPEVGAVVIARPTRSLALYLQMVGRALRPAPGKEEALVLDATGAVVPAFGRAEDYTRFELTRDRVSPEQVRGAGAPREEGGRSRAVLEGKGELREYAPSLEERRRFYQGLLWYAKEKGYKPGFAYYAYRERFGEAPRKEWGGLPPLFDKEAYVFARTRGRGA